MPMIDMSYDGKVPAHSSQLDALEQIHSIPAAVRREFVQNILNLDFGDICSFRA